MSKIIGIDLGTTNSCVAVMEGNEPVVIPNAEAFANVEGEVAANLEILSHNMEVVTLNVTRTESCASFKIIAGQRFIRNIKELRISF